MKSSEIIEELREKLAIQSGRHLYGIIGNYSSLKQFAIALRQVKIPDQKSFPAPVNVTRGILDAIPDEEFMELAENEARMPEPTAAHVQKAFETFLRAELKKNQLVVLEHLELLFAYHLELTLLRTLAANENRIILLLHGLKAGNSVRLFPEIEDAQYKLPDSLIIENHLWEIKD